MPAKLWNPLGDPIPTEKNPLASAGEWHTLIPRYAGSLLFVPCPLAVIVFVCLAALFSAAGIFFVFLFASPNLGIHSDTSSPAAYSAFLLAVAALCLTPALAFASALRNFASARLELDEQLRTFDVRKAGCSDVRDRERVEKCRRKGFPIVNGGLVARRV